MEIVKEEKNIKEPLSESETERQLKLYLEAWKASDFYTWVHKIIDREMEISHLSEVMASRYAEGIPMTNEEIGEQAKIDFQTKLRIQAIKDILS